MRIWKLFATALAVVIVSGVLSMWVIPWQMNVHAQNLQVDPEPLPTDGPNGLRFVDGNSQPPRTYPDPEQPVAIDFGQDAAVGPIDANVQPARPEPIREPVADPRANTPENGTPFLGDLEPIVQNDGLEEMYDAMSGQRIEQRTTVRRLDRLNAVQVADVLKALFGREQGFVVTAEPVTNTLIVRSSDATLEDVFKLISQLEETHARAEAEAAQAAIEADAEAMMLAERDQLLNAVEAQKQGFEMEVQQLQAPNRGVSQFMPADKDAAVLWSSLQKLEQRSMAVARSLQGALTMFTEDHPTVKKMRAELRMVIEQSFQLRLQAQEREVAALTQRLAQVKHRLRRRGELRDRIIDRRLNELTGEGDETLWDPAPQTLPRPSRQVPQNGFNPFGGGPLTEPDNTAASVFEGTELVPTATEYPNPFSDTPVIGTSTVRVEFNSPEQKIPIVVSGTVFTGQKLIVTTGVPVAPQVGGFQVRFENGTTSAAAFLGANTSTGLTLLRADQVPNAIRGLNLAKDHVKAGDRVSAAWFQGKSGLHVGRGIVAAIDRTVNDRPAVQTDLSFADTGVGGPLVNQSGQLVGVLSVATDNDTGSISFAAPLDAVRSLLNFVDVEPGATTPLNSKPDAELSAAAEPMVRPDPRGAGLDLPLDGAAPVDLAIRRRLVESRFQYRAAEEKYERNKALHARKALSDTELERAETEAQAAKAMLQATEQLLLLQLNRLTARISLARKEYEIAQNEFDVAEQANERVRGVVTQADLLKLTLAAERAKTALNELVSLHGFLADAIPQPTEDPGAGSGEGFGFEGPASPAGSTVPPAKSGAGAPTVPRSGYRPEPVPASDAFGADDSAELPDPVETDDLGDPVGAESTESDSEDPFVK